MSLYRSWGKRINTFDQVPMSFMPDKTQIEKTLHLYFLFHRGPGELSADDVARLGVLRKGLDKDDVKDMKPEAQAELEAYNDDLDEEAAKQLFKSRRGGGGSRRKRSTTGRISSGY